MERARHARGGAVSEAVPPAALPDTYQRPAGDAQAETKVLGSRFLARAARVDGLDDVQALLARLRRAEYDATHHVSAYRLGPETPAERADDDGEPSGSSGAPVLRQIVARELWGVAVVVTRWFGGTKLGTGGLVRAYGEAAALALDAAGVETATRRVPLAVRFAYADTSAALHAIGRFDALTLETTYGDDTALRLAVRASQADALVAAFVDATAGRGSALRLP